MHYDLSQIPKTPIPTDGIEVDLEDDVADEEVQIHDLPTHDDLTAPPGHT